MSRPPWMWIYGSWNLFSAPQRSWCRLNLLIGKRLVCVVFASRERFDSRRRFHTRRGNRPLGFANRRLIP